MLKVWQNLKKNNNQRKIPNSLVVKSKNDLMNFAAVHALPASLEDVDEKEM